MKKLFLFIPLTFLMACAPLNQNLNYSVKMAASIESELINDSFAQLSKVYPAASTNIAIQTPQDRFGMLLIETMRQHGYAIQELLTPDSETAPDHLKMFYSVDAVNNEYFVKINIGRETLSRSYELWSNGQLVPVSNWSRGVWQ